VQAVLDQPDDMGPALAHVLLCPNTLRNAGISAPDNIQVLPMGAVEAIARMQQVAGPISAAEQAASSALQSRAH
jgi:hypothetical protein